MAAAWTPVVLKITRKQALLVSRAVSHVRLLAIASYVSNEHAALIGLFRIGLTDLVLTRNDCLK
jgi:hypothetical protein